MCALEKKTVKKSTSSKSKAGAKSNKVRIRLKSYDCRQIDAVVRQIVDLLKESDTHICGPIPLPTKLRKYCVNSSTHVDKKSGEHFEIRVHSRILELIDPADDTMATLQKIDLPAGVGVTIQVLEGSQ